MRVIHGHFLISHLCVESLGDDCVSLVKHQFLEVEENVEEKEDLKGDGGTSPASCVVSFTSVHVESRFVSEYVLIFYP